MSNSSQATAKNIASLLKKGIIARLNGNGATEQLLHFKELGMGIADKSILRAAFIPTERRSYR